MNQEQFEAQNSLTWDRYEDMLLLLENKGNVEKIIKKVGSSRQFTDGFEVSDYGEAFPGFYRTVSKHLALATDRRYSAHIIDRLNNLVMRGHNILYVPKAGSMMRLAKFFAIDFPAAVRKEWRLVLLCHLLFYGPFLGMLLLIHNNPDMIYSVLPLETVHNMESMYDPGNSVERGLGTDIGMFGFYIRNNIGIGFRSFASGALAGIGSLFLTVFNGFYIGAVFGHMTNLPFNEKFFTFVIGHGAFELTAIVLAAVGGFRLGLGLVFPGQLSRRESLRKAGETGVVIAFGMAAMLLLAAFVEAFWSPRELDAGIKYSVGTLLWLATAAYFLFSGRQR